MQHQRLKIKFKIVTFLGIVGLLAGILLTVLISLQEIRQHAVLNPQHAVGLGNIVIDYTSPRWKLDPTAIGMDLSGYGYPNVFANDQVEQQKLKMLGITYMRMDLKYTTPGDPTSKIVCAANGCDTRWTGDQWVQAIKAIDAQPLIIIPYSAADAANMVKHFNKDTNNYIEYWIVGNEPDRAGISAAMYSTNFNQAYDAMKAIDPTIKIGGGTTAWYDAPFLQTFLQQSGSRVDFVDFHGYAQEGTATGDYTALFQNAIAYGDSINNLRSLIQKIAPARASQINIEVGEWELNWGGSVQDNTNFHAVWVASVLGHILSSGGWSLFYADKGNAIYGNPHTFTDPYGHVVNIKPDDTNPAYHGIGMFTGEGLFRGFGNIMVRASTTLPNVEVFASDNPKNIVVINKDPSITQTATVSLSGVTSGTIDVWRKDESVIFPNPPIKLGTLPLQNGTFTYQLTPFSVTTFVLNTTSQTPPTLSPSPSVTPSPTAGVTLAQDTFQRANQTYWGTASDGQKWGGDANSSHAGPTATTGTRHISTVPILSYRKRSMAPQRSSMRQPLSHKLAYPIPCVLVLLARHCLPKSGRLVVLSQATGWRQLQIAHSNQATVACAYWCRMVQQRTLPRLRLWPSDEDEQINPVSPDGCRGGIYDASQHRC